MIGDVPLPETVSPENPLLLWDFAQHRIEN
jgi:hypothetical protein